MKDGQMIWLNMRNGISFMDDQKLPSLKESIVAIIALLILAIAMILGAIFSIGNIF